MAGKFELKKSKNEKFFFNLKAGNGQIILTSEMYETKASALNGIESVKRNADDDARYENRATKAGEPFFVLKATNGQEIGRSESYSSDAGLKNGIESVKKNAPDAEIDQSEVSA